MYLLAINDCNSYAFLQIIYLIKVVLQIISIAVPIILIVTVSIKLIKAMAIGEEEIRKVTSRIIKTAISAIVIFLIPTIVSVVFSLLGQNDYESALCWNEATADNVREAKINERISKYKSEAESVTAQLSIVLEKLAGNLTEEEQQEVDEITNKLNESIEKKDVSSTSTNVRELKSIYKKLYIKQREIVWEDINSKLEKLVASSGASSDGLSLVMQYEGNEGYCDDSHTTYRATNIGDGTITAGYGVTNYDQALAISLGYGQYFPMSSGDCVPVDVLDNILASDYSSKEQVVKDELSKYNLTWKQNQIDAVVSLAYNCGDSYISKLVKAYAEGGDQGIWDNGFNTCIRATNGNPAFNEGLMNRRKSEYNLFLNGTYEKGF